METGRKAVMKKHRVRKADVETEFWEDISPMVRRLHSGKVDVPALREAWNNYTDILCKDGTITEAQCHRWLAPKALR